MTIVAGALVIVALERWRPYDRGQRFLRDGLWTDLVLYGLVQSYILGLVILTLMNWTAARIDASGQGVITGWPFASQIALFVVTHDLYIYGFHRWQHRSRWLWRLHEIHHSSREVDWIAGMRSHALEMFINQSIEFNIMILLGAGPDVILCKGAISAVWGMWIHANIDVRSGPLQYVINGPEMHRWHHAIDYHGAGSNYGTKLAIWDWLFGTAYHPLHKPAGYGLAGRFPSGYCAHLLHPFRRVAKQK